MALIELDQVSKEYRLGPTRVLALDQVSLKIEKGEFVSVIGPSGSGKSTLMNVLGLLEVPNSGHYRLNGIDVTTLDDDEASMLRNQTIGFVFQSFHLLPRLSALRNVELPLIYSASHDKTWTRKAVSERAVLALERVGLSGRSHHRPNELSGGERQRVAIARALVNSPSLLLADEPTGNLDSKTGAEILTLFEELHHQGTTLLLVTHDAANAARAHRTLKFLDGHLAGDILRAAS